MPTAKPPTQTNLAAQSVTPARSPTQPSQAAQSVTSSAPDNKATPSVPTAQPDKLKLSVAYRRKPQVCQQLSLQLSQAKQPRVSSARPQIIKLPPSVPTAQPDKLKLSVAYRPSWTMHICISVYHVLPDWSFCWVIKPYPSPVVFVQQFLKIFENRPSWLGIDASCRSIKTSDVSVWKWKKC